VAIKTRFIMPLAAFNALRTLGYEGTVDTMFATMCRATGCTDSVIRHKALSEGTTITEAVRRIVVNLHPEAGEHWPPKRTQPKPHQAVEPLPSDDAQAVVVAVSILRALKSNRDDGRTWRRAHKFIAKHSE
jgi:hypothetical protein